MNYITFGNIAQEKMYRLNLKARMVFEKNISPHEIEIYLNLKN